MCSSNKLPILILIGFVSISAGCTHSQLRYNHTRQAQTVTGIYERQVLDNLAMFVADPDALPFFSIPEAGSSQVTDNGALSADPLNGPARTILSLSNLSRNNYGSWSFKPLSDPSKLKLMRCAYRHALGLPASDGCTDCCELNNNFYGNETGCNSLCCIAPIKYKILRHTLCLKPCQKVGTYCGCTIEVCPESYDDFNRLVFKILDYAVNDPTPKLAAPVADVEHYHYLRDENNQIIFDQLGRPVTDYIDRFKAKAHPFQPTDQSEDTVEPVSGPGATGLFGIGADLDDSELLIEQIRQQRRDAILPRF